MNGDVIAVGISLFDAVDVSSSISFPRGGKKAAFDWQVNSQVALLFYVSSATSASGALTRTGEPKPIFWFHLYHFIASG